MAQSEEKRARLSARFPARGWAGAVVAGALAAAAASAIVASPPDAAPSGTAARFPTAAEPESFADVAAGARDAVVFISAERRHRRAPAREGGSRHVPRTVAPGVPRWFTPPRARGVGSGFVIDPGGYIVTNHHVVGGSDELRVTLADGEELSAHVVGVDSKTDLALIKVEAGRALTAVEFGDSDRTRVGDWVIAIGNPFGLGGSVSAGIVSARGRNLRSGSYVDYLQVDAPINRGNSGGPLFDRSGRVIGVNTAIYSPTGGGNIGIGFAVPSAVAGPVVAALRAHGRVDRGWLGVGIQTVTEPVARGLGLEEETGVLVVAVSPESPAAGAGLRIGDVLLEVAGQTVRDAAGAARAIGARPSGTEVTLRIRRQGQSELRVLRLGDAPDSGAPAGAG